MSNILVDELKKIGSGLMTIESFAVRIFSDAEKVKSAIDALPADTKSTFVKIFTDLTAVASTVVQAAESEFVNIPLDITAFNALKVFVADAKAGVKEAEAFYNTLGIKL